MCCSNVAKAGVIHLTRSLALELAAYCKLQYLRQLFVEFSIENAEIMETYR